MDIDPVITAIKKITATAVSPMIHQAQRNETVIKVFRYLKLDPLQMPKDFEGVYAFALVEYGVGKPESILKLFREKEVKTAFWKAFNDNDLDLVKYTENFLDWNILGDEIREAEIDYHQELEEFSKVFTSVAKRSRNPVETIHAQNKINKPLDNPSYAGEFKALIEEKIKTFCGRQFVFDEFNSFLKKHHKGYFTVIGDAGMGKSTIAAKYVYDHKAICYFNVLAEGRNKPEQFLKSICQQLMNRYQLENVENADLPTLLTLISNKLTTDQRLVIVVDALDEVEQPRGGENLLYLPKTLPEKIYFLLTRRHYEPNKKRLLTEGVKQEELDLTASQYAEENKKDVKDYISLFINDDPDHNDDLKKWIQERNISPKDFIEQVAAKSENNFMYLRYMLPDIAKGLYQDLSIQKLPNGLQEYYQQHWVRMEMENQPKKLMVIVLFILVEIGTAITCEMIAKIAQQDEVDVAGVLDEWREYLKKQEIQGEICHSLYHASFVDFLKGKRELKSSRKLFDEVNRLRSCT